MIRRESQPVTTEKEQDVTENLYVNTRVQGQREQIQTSPFPCPSCHQASDLNNSQAHGFASDSY